MRIFNYKFIVVIVLFFSHAGRGFPQNGEIANIFERLSEAEHGRFVLEGRVVDQHGKDLNGVAIRLEKVKEKVMGIETVEHEETLVVNGMFLFDVSGYAWVNIYFTKDGYYSTQRHFSIDLHPNLENKIIEDNLISPQILTRDDLQIVLEKKENETTLLSYGHMLAYSGLGKGEVLNFDKPHLGKKAVEVVPNVHDASRLPLNSVYIVPDRNPDSSLALVQIPRSYGEKSLDFFPKRVLLIMNDPNGGFVPFEPVVKKNHYHQMKQAPETGYKRELILTPEYFSQSQGSLVHSQDNEQHFFFKTFGKYGKGSIGEVVVDQSNTRIRLGAQFRIQPDGSRNLETDEGLGRNFTPVPTEDTTAPVLSIVGDSPVTVECGDTYVDAGATALDNTNGDLTGKIDVVSNVDTSLVGAYSVTYSVNDSSGNPASETRTVNVVDSTAPQIICPGDISVGCSVDQKVAVYFDTTASDLCDPNPVVSCTPSSGSGFSSGITNVSCTATDASSNTDLCDFSVIRTPLKFEGFLPPIGGADATGGSVIDPVRTFKLGSVIPMKFNLGCNDTKISTGLHRLQLIKHSDKTTTENPVDASPSDTATTGNEFRFADGEWHYNLDTDAAGMTVGIWELRVELSDGSTHAVWIGLR